MTTRVPFSSAAPALLALLLCLLPGTALRAQPQSGQVTVSVGEVRVTPPGGEPAPLNAGDTVAVGSVVTTGAGARAVIVMTPLSAIRVAENSEVLVEEVEEDAAPPRVTLDLKNGSLGALLKPGAGAEMDFKVRTPTGVAAARGTFFAVVVEDGKGYAQVRDGRIEIAPTAEDPN